MFFLCMFKKLLQPYTAKKKEIEMRFLIFKVTEILLVYFVSAMQPQLKKFGIIFIGR